MTDNEKDKLLEKYDVIIDKSLDEKYKGKILFPEKLAAANRMIEEVGLPDFEKLELERKEKEANEQTSADESSSTD